MERILAFIRSFGDRWFVAMSGVLGVPLTIAGYLVAGDVAKGILFLTGIGCAIFSSFWVWDVERKARQKAEAVVFHPFIDIEQSFLFSEPPQYETWKAKLIPTKNVSNVEVCLDLSSYSGGVGHNFWTPKRRLSLSQKVTFVIGAEVSIDLVKFDDNSGNAPFWRWATNMHDGGEPILFTCYRCQLVFISPQEPPDYFDFVVDFHYKDNQSNVKTPTPQIKTPALVGENRFLYAREWKSINAASHP